MGVHRVDELVGDQGISGVGRVDAIEREGTTEEIGGDAPAADDDAGEVDEIEEGVDIDERRVDRLGPSAGSRPPHHDRHSEDSLRA